MHKMTKKYILKRRKMTKMVLLLPPQRFSSTNKYTQVFYQVNEWDLLFYFIYFILK